MDSCQTAAAKRESKSTRKKQSHANQRRVRKGSVSLGTARGSAFTAPESSLPRRGRRRPSGRASINPRPSKHPGAACVDPAFTSQASRSFVVDHASTSQGWPLFVARSRRFVCRSRVYIARITGPRASITRLHRTHPDLSWVDHASTSQGCRPTVARMLAQRRNITIFRASIMP